MKKSVIAILGLSSFILICLSFLAAAPVSVVLNQGLATTVVIDGYSHMLNLTAVSTTQAMIMVDGSNTVINLGAVQNVNGLNINLTSVFPNIPQGWATISIQTNQASNSQTKFNVSLVSLAPQILSNINGSPTSPYAMEFTEIKFIFKNVGSAISTQTLLANPPVFNTPNFIPQGNATYNPETGYWSPYTESTLSQNELVEFVVFGYFNSAGNSNIAVTFGNQTYSNQTTILPSLGCYSSNNGNIYTQGWTIGTTACVNQAACVASSRAQDTCQNSTTLNEFVCSPDPSSGGVLRQYVNFVNCPAGCLNGACIRGNNSISSGTACYPGTVACYNPSDSSAPILCYGRCPSGTQIYYDPSCGPQQIKCIPQIRGGPVGAYPDPTVAFGSTPYCYNGNYPPCPLNSSATGVHSGDGVYNVSLNDYIILNNGWKMQISGFSVGGAGNTLPNQVMFDLYNPQGVLQNGSFTSPTNTIDSAQYVFFNNSGSYVYANGGNDIRSAKIGSSTNLAVKVQILSMDVNFTWAAINVISINEPAPESQTNPNSCISSGYSCIAPEVCSNGGGSVFVGYSCPGVTICCNVTSGSSITEPNTANGVVSCDSGCLSNGKCLPYGYRVGSSYCNVDNSLTDQINSGTCSNNFECSSNLCANSECVTPGFLQQIINFFKRLFGIQDQPPVVLNQTNISNDETNLVIYPASNELTLSRGGIPAGFAFSLKNPESNSATFDYTITATDISNCGNDLTTSIANSYLLTSSGTFTLDSGATSDTQLIKFNIPASAPRCTIVYGLNVNETAGDKGFRSNIFVTIQDQPTGVQQTTGGAQCLNSVIRINSVTCNKAGDNCNVTIQRTSGTDTLGGVRLVFATDNGDRKSIDIPGDIASLTQVTSSNINIGLANINEVDAAMYFLDSVGNKNVCSVAVATHFTAD